MTSATQNKNIWWLALAVVALTGCGKSADAPATAGGGSQSPRARSAERTVEDLHPTVLIRTSLGDITARLDAEHAPLTVDNFLTYAAMGQYSGTIFHQVDAGFIALGGGFTPDLAEKPTQIPIRNEARNGLKNRRGTLAMSRQADVIDSSTCQFFINLADNAALDYQGDDAQPYAWNGGGNVATASLGGAAPAANSDRAKQYGYCVFGEITAGQEVLDRLAKVEVHASGAFDKLPVQSVTILEVRRLR